MEVFFLGFPKSRLQLEFKCNYLGGYSRKHQEVRWEV